MDEITLIALDLVESMDRTQKRGGIPRLPVRTPIFATREWVAPDDGYAIVAVMSGAGSGARAENNYGATGGYSAAWAVKLIRVTKGQRFVVVIGAGGAAPTAYGGGNPGGDSSVTVMGVTHVVPGGLGGVYSASNTVAPVLIDGPIISDPWWSAGAASVKPGSVAGGRTGGAGVDILGQGNNATTSASVHGSGGGGTGAPSVDGSGGGALPGGRDANGSTISGSTIPIPSDLWLLPFWGGGGARSTTDRGGNGGGGAGLTATGAGGDGGLGGGGGCGYGAGKGGLGAGGGACVSTVSGQGGDGYCCITFLADVGRTS
jgi:hypothetical protein